MQCIHLPPMLRAFAPHAPCLCSKLQPPLLCQCGFLMFPESPSSNSSFRNFMRRPDFVMVTLNPKSQNQGKCVITSLFTRKVEIVYSLVFFLPLWGSWTCRTLLLFTVCNKMLESSKISNWIDTVRRRRRSMTDYY
jgi:hypothetical protein